MSLAGSPAPGTLSQLLLMCIVRCKRRKGRHWRLPPLLMRGKPFGLLGSHSAAARVDQSGDGAGYATWDAWLADLSVEGLHVTFLHFNILVYTSNMAEQKRLVMKWCSDDNIRGCREVSNVETSLVSRGS